MQSTFVRSVETALTTSPVSRLRGILQLAVPEMRFQVAQVTAIDPYTEAHVVLADVGYDRVVSQYYGSRHFTRDCMGFRVQRRRRDELLAWDDIPGFSDSFTACEVLRPAGYRNGLSAPLYDARGTLVGVCNVNTPDESVSHEQKQLLAELRPALTSAVGDALRVSRFSLTPREAEVLSLLPSGLSNREIGSHLVISSRTVSTHVERILTKMGAANRVEAASMAVALGLASMRFASTLHASPA